MTSGVDHLFIEDLVSPELLATRPRVSVAIHTYNHAQFIAQAIEGVLGQKIFFPIELVIGEDCSTDATRDVVRRYAAENPRVIRALLPSRNRGALANSKSVLSRCRGEYIAMLDGDDYWTTPHKLQKQVEFLDRHPDYSICAHRAMHVFPERPDRTPEPSPAQKESGTLEDILRSNYLPTCSVVYRAAVLGDLPTWIEGLSHGDWPMWVLLAERGRIGFVNEIMADYRVHSGGVWMGASLEAKLAATEKTIIAIHQHLRVPYASARRHALFSMYVHGASEFNRRMRYSNARSQLLRAMASSPIEFATSLDVRRVVQEQTRFYLVVNGLERIKRGYFRGRIWVGAVRRKTWKSAKSLVGM